jgi:hypothetical protein
MMNTQLLSKTLCAALFAASMLFGSSVFAQVKIGTNPTTIDPASNLEVEASTTGRKVTIDKSTGKVMIKDGTEGNARVLTSDANGVASWQSGAAAGLSQLVFAGYSAAEQSVPQDNGLGVIRLVSEYDPSGAWNAAGNEFTIAEAGYYSISFGGKSRHTVDANDISGGFSLQLYKTSTSDWETIVGYRSESAPTYFRSLGGTLTVKVSAGDKIRVVSSTCLCGGTQVWTVKESTLAISRIR